MRNHLSSKGILCLLLSMFSISLLASNNSDANSSEDGVLLICNANVNISLPASGTIEILPSFILNSGTDLSGVDTVYVTPRFFSCNDIGTHNVVVTAVCPSGINSCFSTVTIEDKITPSLVCASNVNVSLDQFGNATLLPEDLILSYSDNCDVTFSLSQSSFNCNDVGNTYPVIVTATDAGGNATLCISNVTIEDKTVPLLSCVNTLVVSLDQNGLANVIPENFVISAIDNCNITLSAIPSGFNCSDLNISHPIYITATDDAGNSTQCLSFVDVEDKISPTAICFANIQLDLAGNSSVNLNISDVDAGSFDNCSIINRFLSQSIFTTADLGMNSVTMTVEDQSGNSNSCIFNVELIDSGLSYCTASGNNTSFEYIKRVKLRQIKNTSGDNGGYADFTSMQAKLKQGKNYKLVLKPGFPGISYNENWKVWIDWNQDGDFDDLGEEIYAGSSNGKITHFFDVPAAAPLGITRMRVAMQYGSSPNSCGNFTFGEVEDYSILVKAGPTARLADANIVSQKDEINFQVYPNPAKHYCYIEIEQFDQVHSLNLYNAIGKRIYSIPGNQLTEIYQLNLIDLPEGIYIIQLKTADQISTKKLYHLSSN